MERSWKCMGNVSKQEKIREMKRKAFVRNLDKNSRKSFLCFLLIALVIAMGVNVSIESYRYYFKVIRPEYTETIYPETLAINVMPYYANLNTLNFSHINIEETFTKKDILIDFDIYFLIESTTKEPKILLNVFKSSGSYEDVSSGSYEDVIRERYLYLRPTTSREFEKINEEMISEGEGGICINLSPVVEGDRYNLRVIMILEPCQKMKEGYGCVDYKNNVYATDEFVLGINIPGYERSVFLDKSNVTFNSNTSQFYRKFDGRAIIEIRIGESIQIIALDLAIQTVFLSVLIAMLSIFISISPKALPELELSLRYSAMVTRKDFRRYRKKFFSFLKKVKK